MWKKKKYFNFFFLINRKLKNKWREFNKLKIPLFFFNNYKKKMFIVLIQFYNYIFKLKIKHIKAFISYWILFYKNFMKFLYVNINNFLKIYISILFKQYKNIYSFFFF